MLSSNQIRRVATKVRKHVEEHIAPEMYYIYGTKPETLDCCCAIASCILFEELKKLGGKVKLHYSNCHVAMSCDGYFVDITAKQFDYDYPKVMVRKKLPNKYFWVFTHAFTSLVEFCKWQEKEGWPITQRYSNWNHLTLSTE